MASSVIFKHPLTTLLSLSFVVFLSVSSCAPDKQQETSPEQEEEYLPDSTNTEGMAFTEECFQLKNTICELGLDFVRLGDSIHHISLDEIPEGGWKDTIMNGSGYNWKSITLALGNGEITIEGDFVDERLPIENVYRAPVNRIRIETTEYQTVASLRVGSTVSDINSLYPDSLIQLTPIPSFEAIQVTTLDGSHMNYIIADPGNQLSTQYGGQPTIQNLPSSSEISAIVVM